MARLDAELDLLLAEKRYFEKHPEAGQISISPDKIIFISLKFKGDLKALEQIGFQVGNTVGQIAFGSTTLTGLEALANHPNVEIISKQRRASIDLDGSIPDIKANQIWARSGNTFTGYTGRDVMVGLIDTGIDFRHHTFRKQDGKTRILKIWDQTLTATADEEAPQAITHATIASNPTPLGYGVEYTNAAIDNTLEKESAGETPVTPVRHKDTDGHGSHVAGIAAGDGSQNGRCKGAYSYVGVAPEANLIVVRLWGLTKGDINPPASPNSFKIDAIRYILNEARIAGKPVVINLSLGVFSDMMDGTSPECQAVDTLLTNNSTGTAIVFTAGNNAQKQFHASLTVPGNTTSVENLHFKIASDDAKIRRITIFYSGSNLQVQLTSPVNGANGMITWLSSGNSNTSNTANGTGGSVFIDHAADRINIRISPPASGNNKSGTWKLEFKNTNTTPTAIDAFCLYGSGAKAAYFKDHHTTRSTLGEYATCQQSITVGSYEVGKRLAASSSRGPTLDGRTKPEFCAPGVDIASAGIPSDRTEFTDYICFKACCCDCCEDYYVDKSGTSMAAPHVTGLVALMLHKNPNLTHTEIKTLIKGHTRPKPADSTAEENLGWGSGKIEAVQVMSNVTEITPAITGTGGTEIISIPLNPLPMLHERFLGTERGPEFLHLFRLYVDEIKELINKNKRVATVWHRCKGPVWVRLAIRAAYSPEMTIPMQVDGIHFQEGFQRIVEIVKRYASQAFIHDLSKYEHEIVKVEEGMTLLDWIDSLGNNVLASTAEPIS